MSPEAWASLETIVLRRFRVLDRGMRSRKRLCLRWSGWIRKGCKYPLLPRTLRSWWSCRVFLILQLRWWKRKTWLILARVSSLWCSIAWMKRAIKNWEGIKPWLWMTRSRRTQPPYSTSSIEADRGISTSGLWGRKQLDPERFVLPK